MLLIISDGMSGYLTAAGGYYAPAMTAQQLAGLGAHAGNAGLAAYAAAAPPGRGAVPAPGRVTDMLYDGLAGYMPPP